MNPDPSQHPLTDEIQRLCRQIDEQGREYWWIKASVAAAFEARGYHLLPRHFYSPVPDPGTAAEADPDNASYPLPESIFHEERALILLDSVAGYSGELNSQFPSLKLTED